jgi:hypothetical protein
MLNGSVHAKTVGPYRIGSPAPTSRLIAPAQVATALTSGATTSVATSPGSGSPNRLLRLVP